MAEFYQMSLLNINIHIQNIYNEEELEPKATIKESLIVQKEGAWTVKGHRIFKFGHNYP